jgi:hypothetical protein
MKRTITSRIAYQGMEWRDEHGRARTGRVFRGEGGREPDKFSGHEYIQVLEGKKNCTSRCKGCFAAYPLCYYVEAHKIDGN